MNHDDFDSLDDFFAAEEQEQEGNGFDAEPADKFDLSEEQVEAILVAYDEGDDFHMLACIECGLSTDQLEELLAWYGYGETDATTTPNSHYATGGDIYAEG